MHNWAHMERDAFRESLLAIMEEKTHWAWPAFASGLVPKSKLHVHLEQEYATYVRDFGIWGTVAITVISGLLYIQRAVAMYREKPPGM